MFKHRTEPVPKMQQFFTVNKGKHCSKEDIKRLMTEANIAASVLHICSRPGESS